VTALPPGGLVSDRCGVRLTVNYIGRRRENTGDRIAPSSGNFTETPCFRTFGILTIPLADSAINVMRMSAGIDNNFKALPVNVMFTEKPTRSKAGDTIEAYRTIAMRHIGGVTTLNTGGTSIGSGIMLGGSNIFRGETNVVGHMGRNMITTEMNDPPPKNLNPPLELINTPVPSTNMMIESGCGSSKHSRSSMETFINRSVSSSLKP